MKEVMTRINEAHSFISRLLVNGDNVDLVASARHALRLAYIRADELTSAEKEKEVEKNGNDNRQAAENAE